MRFNINSEKIIHIIGCLIISCVPASAANKKCPLNMSQSCNCKSDQSGLTIACNYGNSTTEKLLNVNSSNVTPMSIYKLNISRNSLHSLPSNYFEGIGSITYIDMSHNNFINIPSMLSDIQNIITLDMSNCKINTLTLHGLGDVQSLNLSRNVLERLEVDSFRNTSKLRTIDLSHNKLSSLPDSLFINLIFLQELHLSSNKISAFTRNTFKGLQSSLRKFYIANNNINSIHSDIFESFHSLKTLDLSKNTNFKSLNEINFPTHLSYLDLSECNIQQIDDCKFRKLIDLEFLNLQGNQLPCSCHVTWLYQWIAENQESDPYHETITVVPWQCVQNGNGTVPVNSESICDDHSPMPNHCDSNYVVVMTTETFTLNLQVDLEDDTLQMSWDPVNITFLHEYRVTITNMDTGENIKSIFLHKTSEEYTAQYNQLKSGDFSVCLQVLHNETTVSYEECRQLTNSPTSIVVGILAGVVFLIPCIIALIYIIKKDRLYNKMAGYTEFKVQNEEKEIGSKVLVKISSSDSVKKGSDVKKVTTNPVKKYDNNLTVPNAHVMNEQHENKMPVLSEITTTNKSNHATDNSNLENGQDTKITIDSGQANLSYVPDTSVDVQCKTENISGFDDSNGKSDQPQHNDQEDTTMMMSIRL